MRVREKKPMSQEKKPINQNLTVPNALSVLRIVIIPFFAWFFLKDQLLEAVALLVLSGLSDCVDGFLARKLNQVTELRQPSLRHRHRTPESSSDILYNVP